jgi:hypothetical protein
MVSEIKLQNCVLQCIECEKNGLQTMIEFPVTVITQFIITILMNFDFMSENERDLRCNRLTILQPRELLEVGTTYEDSHD